MSQPARDQYLRVALVVFGLIFLVGGGWLLVFELQHPPAHSGHVYLFAGLAIFGGLCINPMPNQPSPLIVILKQVVVTVAPIVPWSKVAQARRASQPITKVEDAEK